MYICTSIVVCPCFSVYDDGCFPEPEIFSMQQSVNHPVLGIWEDSSHSARSQAVPRMEKQRGQMIPWVRAKLMKHAPVVLIDLLVHGHSDLEAGMVHQGMTNHPSRSSGGPFRWHHQQWIILWMNRWWVTHVIFYVPSPMIQTRLVISAKWSKWLGYKFLPVTSSSNG